TGSGLGSVSVSITKDGVEIYNASDATGSFNCDSYGLGTYAMSVSATDADNDRPDDALTTSTSPRVSVSDDDTEAPIITLGGSTGAETDGQDQMFTWSVTDAGSGIGSVLVSITRDGVEIYSSTNASGSFDFNAFGLGTYEMHVGATDADNDRVGDAM